MREYRVYGADRESGIDFEINLVAADHLDAENRAAERGLLVRKIVEVQITKSSANENVLPVRLWIGIISGLGMLGTFMPWVSMPIIGSINGTGGDGWFSFAGFALAMLVGLSPSPRKPIHVGRRVIVFLLGLGAAGLGISKVISIADIRSDNMDDGAIAAVFSQSVNVGIGIWVILACGIGISVVSVSMSRQK